MLDIMEGNHRRNSLSIFRLCTVDPPTDRRAGQMGFAPLDFAAQVLPAYQTSHLKDKVTLRIHTDSKQWGIFK